MKVTLAFEKSNTTFAKIIQWWTKCKYAHVEIIIEDKWISSDSTYGGVGIHELRPLTDKWDYLEVDVDGRKLSKVMRFIEENKDKSYDWCGIICSVAFKITRAEHENKWFCSEMVTKILQEFGNKQVQGLIPANIVPKDLYYIFKD